jgi:hypothetical protein
VLDNEHPAEGMIRFLSDIDDTLRGGLRGVWRIGEYDIEKCTRLRRALKIPQGVADANLRSRRRKTAPFEVRAKRLENPFILLDEDGSGGPPAQRFDADGSGAGEEVEDRGPLDLESDGIEDGAFDELLRRPEERPMAAAQSDPLFRTGNNPHGNLARTASEMRSL